MSSVVIQLHTDLGLEPLEMRSATTVKYAAKRAAEFLKVDPETPGLGLAEQIAGVWFPVREEDLVDSLDGKTVVLFMEHQSREKEGDNWSNGNV